jgi:hypothetical protein
VCVCVWGGGGGGCPCFVGEHLLEIKHWEPYFKASATNLSFVVV